MAEWTIREEADEAGRWLVSVVREHESRLVGRVLQSSGLSGLRGIAEKYAAKLNRGDID